MLGIREITVHTGQSDFKECNLIFNSGILFAAEPIERKLNFTLGELREQYL